MKPAPGMKHMSYLLQYTWFIVTLTSFLMLNPSISGVLYLKCIHLCIRFSKYFLSAFHARNAFLSVFHLFHKLLKHTAQLINRLIIALTNIIWLRSRGYDRSRSTLLKLFSALVAAETWIKMSGQQALFSTIFNTTNLSFHPFQTSQQSLLLLRRPRLVLSRSTSAGIFSRKNCFFEHFSVLVRLPSLHRPKRDPNNMQVSLFSSLLNLFITASRNTPAGYFICFLVRIYPYGVYVNHLL